ncbi:hypothetical protein K438DRAFT_1768964 [Mycena galopus ATCC 62051]|nr:hypothetical protein K438DRAFT_1768964 [Mycena galopus ATCC 62051]
MAAPYMPPTTPALSEAQRRRLVRSTRKLGALLGETPLVADINATTGTAPKSFRLGHSRSVSAVVPDSNRVYTAPSNSISRTSSLRLAKRAGVFKTKSHTDPGIAPPLPLQRPTLFLSLPTPGASSSPESTPLLSPLSPTFGLSPNSPTTSTPTADTTRRRRMAKLVHTLGENIPPELVYAESRPLAHPRSSTLSVPESALESRLGVDLTHDESTVHELELFPSTAEPYAPRNRCSSDSDASESMHTSTVSSFSSRDPMLPEARPRTMSSTHRREKGWSGEWGGDVSMEDVVRTLRALKLK